jgi:amidase
VLVRDAFALAEPDVATALRTHCKTLDIVDEVTLFDDAGDEWRECYRVLQGYEAWQQLGYWIRSAKPRFDEAIARRFAEAASITSADVARYKPVRAAIAARLNAALGDGVGLVMPTAPCIALQKDAGSSEIAEFYRRVLTLTSAAGHAGVPQISVPAGRVDRCPVGLSILASSGHDRALLEAASRWPNPVSERAQGE